ncbi:MAG: hypothetical protein ACXACO_10225 [Promethearchaeota archaeon]|jgi:ribonuclease HIII
MGNKKIQKSIKLDENQIKQLIDIISRKGIPLTKGSSDYELYRIKTDDIFIVIYHSGSVVYKDSNLINEIFEDFKKKSDKDLEAYDYFIGSDEVGKGEWYGPLVTVAVCLQAKDLSKYKVLGFMDSKKLKRDKIYNLFSQIEEHIIRKSVVLYPQKLSDKWEEFSKEGKNYNDILAWTHSRVIFDILDQLDTENSQIRVVIDEFDFLKLDSRLNRYKSNHNITIVQKHKGESEIEVAIASVIAKKIFEETIDEYSKNYKIDVQKTDLNEVPLEILRHIAKSFFKNVQKRELVGRISNLSKKFKFQSQELNEIEVYFSKKDAVLRFLNYYKDNFDSVDYKLINQIYDKKKGELNPKDIQAIISKVLTLEKDLVEKEEIIRKQDKIIDALKGRPFEVDARILLREKFHYDMEDKQFNLNITDQQAFNLHTNSCLKDKSTKSIEIDLYGNKKEQGNIFCALGECKTIKNKMSMKDAKCFLLKASIVAFNEIENFTRRAKKKEPLPNFELFLVSLKGFNFKPKDFDWKKYWRPDNKRMKKIHFLHGNDLLELFKEIGIQIKHYTL